MLRSYFLAEVIHHDYDIGIQVIYLSHLIKNRQARDFPDAQGGTKFAIHHLMTMYVERQEAHTPNLSHASFSIC